MPPLVRYGASALLGAVALSGGLLLSALPSLLGEDSATWGGVLFFVGMALVVGSLVAAFRPRGRAVSPPSGSGPREEE